MALVGVKTVLDNLTSYETALNNKLKSGMGALAADTQSNAKHEAPWTDRTGNARNSLFGYSNDEGDKIVNYHGIGVFYGVYLELSHQGKYRIVLPVLDLISGSFFNYFK